MFSKTLGIARKYGSKAALAVALAPAFVGVANAAGEDMGTQILAKINGGMSQGELLAGAVVLGLFTIWIIKMLWRSK